MVWCFALSSDSRKVKSLNLTQVVLCGVCMFFLRLHGLSSASLASRCGPETYKSG